jgi:hypothetical protein
LSTGNHFILGKLDPKIPEKEKKKDNGNHEEVSRVLVPKPVKSLKNEMEVLPIPKPTKQHVKEISQNALGNVRFLDFSLHSIDLFEECFCFTFFWPSQTTCPFILLLFW